MYQEFISKTNKALLIIEQKLGVYLSALFIAFVLLCLAAIYVTPALSAIGHQGAEYTQLSISPFNFSVESNLRCRILTPLLAYSLGFRGPLYIIFPLIVSLLFLSVIFYYLRKTRTTLESLFITMLICFSTPILFLLHYAGYTDITSYLLILLTIIYIRKPILCMIFLSLLFLNHESNLFILPALLYFYYINNEGKKTNLYLGYLGMILSLFPIYFYRRYIFEVAPFEYTFKHSIGIILKRISVL